MATCLALLAPAAARADDPDADAARAFGYHLLDEGDHYRAIGELKRSLFLAPDAAEAPAARFAIGLAYLRGAQPDAAAAHFDALSRTLPSPLREEALLQRAYAALLAGRPLEAKVELSGWLRRHGAGVPTPSRHRATYLLGWSALESGDTARAREAFSALPPSPDTPSLLEATAALDTLPQKSPALAGALSLVPGLGHLYLEQPWTAAAAFTWNGLFGYGVYDAFRREAWGTAVVLLVFESLWYFGTMFGAVSGAQKYNRDVRLNALEALQERFDTRPESWPPAPGRALPPGAGR